MASFNHMDKGIGYFNNDNLNQTQENDQFYYGRDAPYGSVSGLPSSRIPSMNSQSLLMGNNGSRSVAPPSLGQQQQQQHDSYQQQQHLMQSRGGSNNLNSYGGGSVIGSSSNGGGLGGMQFSRSLINDDESSTPFSLGGSSLLSSGPGGPSREDQQSSFLFSSPSMSSNNLNARGGGGMDSFGFKEVVGGGNLGSNVSNANSNSSSGMLSGRSLSSSQPQHQQHMMNFQNNSPHSLHDFSPMMPHLMEPPPPPQPPSQAQVGSSASFSKGPGPYAPGATEARSSSGSSSTIEGKFGLMGLLDVIRMSDKDLNTLALGSDLTTFGLSLNSNESLYSTFTSPHLDPSSSGGPDQPPSFVTPKCYMMQPPSLKPDHLSKFQVETLFYMFYAMPRDILQATAAQELYRREWRYHGELKIWLKARGPSLEMPSTTSYVYFDVNVWEAKLFTAAYRGNLMAGVLSDEDVRVKAPLMPLHLSQSGTVGNN